MLVYVDVVLAISNVSEAIMKKIRMEFEIKNDKYRPPTMNIGGNIEEFQLPDGKSAWSLKKSSCIKAAVETVKVLLGRAPQK